MFLPAEEFDISYIEQGPVHQFILDRDNVAIHRQLPAIVKYALSCLGITKRHILITISSTLGERDEFRFYQPYQLWTIMNYEDGDLFYKNTALLSMTMSIFQTDNGIENGLNPQLLGAFTILQYSSISKSKVHQFKMTSQICPHF